MGSTLSQICCASCQRVDKEALRHQKEDQLEALRNDNSIAIRMDTEAKRHQEEVAALKNQLEALRNDNSVANRMDTEAKRHQEEVAALKDQLEALRNNNSIANRMDTEAKRHQEEVAALKKQLGALRNENSRNQLGALRNGNSIVNSRSALSENLNDPCRRSELVIMYRELKTQIWAQTKDEINELQTSERNRLTQLAKNMIKETFEEGTKDKILREMDGILQQTNGMPSPVQAKLRNYIQSSLGNLQMIFFLQFQNINSTSDFKTFVKEKKPSLPEVLHELYVHCYFVSRLMALANPPIELCWEKAGVNAFPDL